MAFQEFSKDYLHILTIISTSIVPLLPVWQVNFTLRLNELVSTLTSLKSVIASLSSTVSSSLQNCHKISDVCEQLSVYSMKLY